MKVVKEEVAAVDKVSYLPEEDHESQGMEKKRVGHIGECVF